MPGVVTPMILGGEEGAGAPQAGGKRRGASVKTLKKMLKKAGLKTTGKKAALTRRAKKAHLKMKGGVVSGSDAAGWTSDRVPGNFATEQEAKDAEAAASKDKDMGGKRRGKKSRSRSRGKLGLMGY